tara:strand:- start:1066 stop:1518 length:453 start_codon:yes stop_codon:yes gene_type:complete
MTMLYTSEEQSEVQMLQSLVNGLNPHGGKVSLPDQMEAGRRLREIMERRKAEERRQQEGDRTHNLTADQQEHDQGMDHSRLALQAQLEERKLDQEDQRIEIAKAEVIVRAIEAAAQHPELKQLMQVVGEMSYRLMGGEVLPALEDHTQED